MTVDTHGTSTAEPVTGPVRQPAPDNHTSPQEPERPVRVAFYGRRASVDTREQGNRSLAMQYLACLRALPADARLVACYYDIGAAGRPHPNPTDHLLVAGRRIGRDGGIATLLTHAATTTRRFDHVILTDTSRLTRQAGDFLATAQRLTALGVGLLVINRADPLHAAPLDQATITLLEHLHCAAHDHLFPPPLVADASTARPTTDPGRSAS
jgi:hypothetical protein